MALRRVLVLAFALAAPLAYSPTGAAGASAPVAFHLSYRLIAPQVQGVVGGGPYLDGSGRYVGYTAVRPRAVEQFVVLDDLAGKRIVTPRGCAAPIWWRDWLLCQRHPAGPYSLYNIRTRQLRKLPQGCGGDGFLTASWIVCIPNPAPLYELYNVRTRKLRRLPCDGLCQQDYYLQNLIAVGSKWFEVEIEPHDSCGDGIHNDCGPTTSAFYNTHTGKQGVPVVSSSETIDLNSVTLRRKLCPPLREPPGYSPTDPIAYTLTFDGSFAVAQQTAGIYLERCGSDLRLALVTAPYEGALILLPRAAAFCAGATEEGFFLPSDQPFTIGAAAVTSGSLTDCPVLGPRHAYAVDAQGQLWAAPLPRKLQNLTGNQAQRHASAR